MIYPAIGADDEGEGLVEPAIVAFAMEHSFAILIQFRRIILIG